VRTWAPTLQSQVIPISSSSRLIARALRALPAACACARHTHTSERLSVLRDGTRLGLPHSEIERGSMAVGGELVLGVCGWRGCLEAGEARVEPMAGDGWPRF
jgi:hypothetical protein